VETMSSSDQANRLGSSGPVAQVSTGPPGAGVVVPPPLPIRPSTSVASGSTSLDRQRPELDPLTSLLEAPPPSERLAMDARPAELSSHVGSVEPPIPATTPGPLPGDAARVAAATPERQSQPENTVGDLVAKFLEACPAEVPHPEGVAVSLGGLRLLAKMRNWSRVQSSAAKLMSDNQTTLDAQLYHMLASLKLDKPPFDALQQQVDKCLEDPTWTGQGELSHHRLALELLHAELCQFREQGHKVCVDRLKRLQERLSLAATGELGPDVVSQEQALLWWRRATMSLVNTAIRSAEWRVALTELDALRHMEPKPQDAVTYDLELASRIKRVYLQMGNVEVAQRFHEESLLAHPDAHSNPRVVMDAGLIAFAASEFPAAIQAFRSVIETERKRLRDGAFLDQRDAGATFDAEPIATTPTFSGLDTEDSLLVEAVNNFAITVMYSCQLDLAIQTLESLIREDPSVNMTDATVFNLCTLYELSCDNKAQIVKKKVLAEIGRRFFLDDLKSTSFRMTVGT